MEEHLSVLWFRRRIGILLILASFLAIVCFLYYYHSISLDGQEDDGIRYMQKATGPLFQVDAFFGPGYSLAIRLVHATGLDLFSSGKFVSLVFGFVFVLAVWLINSSLFASSQEALLGTFLVAFNPLLLFRSVVVSSDMMAASLSLAMLALLLVPKDATKAHLLFAGVLGGLAYLTRYVFIIALVLPILWLLGNPGKRNYMMGAVAFYLGFLIVTLPWFLFMYANTGNPLWNQEYLNIAFRMYGNGSWNTFPSPDQFKSLSDVLLSNPLLFLRGWLVNLAHLPRILLDVFPRVGLLASLGVFLWLAKLDWKRTVYVLFLSLYGLVVCAVWIEDRFLLIMLPLVGAFLATAFLAIPVSIAISSLPNALSSILSRIPLRNAVIVSSIALLGVSGIHQLQASFSDQAPEYQQAAEWLSSLHMTGDVSVMAAKPQMAFFGGVRGIDFRTYRLQFAKPDDLPRVLESVKPTFLIFDERSAAVYLPQFSVLLDPNKSPYSDYLEPVKVIEKPKKLVIYEYRAKPSQ